MPDHIFLLQGFDDSCLTLKSLVVVDDFATAETVILGELPQLCVVFRMGILSIGVRADRLPPNFFVCFFQRKTMERALLKALLIHTTIII